MEIKQFIQISEILYKNSSRDTEVPLLKLG